MKEQITIKITKETKRTLEQLAREEEISVSDVVRKIIREKINSLFFANKSIQINTNNNKAKKGA